MLNSTSKFVIALAIAATPMAAIAGNSYKAETEIEAAETEVEEAPITTQDEVAGATGVETPVLDGETELAANDTAEMPATGEQEVVANIDGQITMQDDGTFLANNLIGATVYSPSEENIGDVNDLIISTSGTVDGVVLGVGGFIGLGEKDVAIAMDELDVQTDSDGYVALVLDATQEELEAAEAFVSSAERRDIEEAERVDADVETATDTGLIDGTIEQ
jgi:hypothetical protein